MAVIWSTLPSIRPCLRNGCAVATVRSKWLRCGHCALEVALLWPLCARNGGAVVIVRPKWLRCGHWALEMAALWPLCARTGCAVATVRSKRLRYGHRAVAMAALWPLCARFDCAYLSFGVTVLLRAVLCAASLVPLCLSFLWSHCAASSCALCGFTGSTVPIFPSESLCWFELCFVRLHWLKIRFSA